MPAVAEDGVSVSDDEPLAFLWPEHLRRPRARRTAAKDTAEEGAAAHLESDVAATVAVPLPVPVPVAVPAAGPEEKPPAPLSRMPWRTPPPPPPPPPPQPPQPPQPQPSKRGRGAPGRGGRDGSVGSGGGAAGGGGGGGGGAASAGDSAGPVSFGFVLDARFRRGGGAGWLLHHPSLPRPAGRRASAANLAAWRAARRATLLGMHPALAAWRGGGDAPCGARYLLTLRVTNRSRAGPQPAPRPAAAAAARATAAEIAARVAARAALASSSCVNYAWLDRRFRPLGRPRLLHACM